MKVVVFGTGKYYQSAKKYINFDDVICFIDNDEEKIGKIFDGRKVKSPDDVDYTDVDYVLVLIMRYDSVSAQLKSLGVPEDKIKYYYNFMDLYNVDFSIKSDNIWMTAQEWLRLGNGHDVLLMCHELDRNGVSVVLMHIAKVLKRMGYRVLMTALLSGNLEEELAENGIDYMTQINLCYESQSFLEFVTKLDFVIAGSLGISNVVSQLSKSDTPIIWWLHESNDKDFKDFKITDKSMIHYYGGGKRVVNCFKKYHKDVKIEEWLYYLPDERVKKKKCDSFKISIIGLINKRKAQDVLLDALDKVSDNKKENITVEIVGKYAESTIDLESVLEKCSYVKYVSEMSQSDLMEYFGTVDLLVCPSRDDPMPVVVTQAMQNGIPCIVSNQVGQSEFIINGENGFVFESENSTQLAKILDYCIDNKDKLERIGLQSRKIYENHFSEETAEKKLRKIMDEFKI